MTCHYATEKEFEAYLRSLIELHVTSVNPAIYALTNKKAVDILICKDAPSSELFFVEVKFHRSNHGRLGFGSAGGGGFQPEILTKRPSYFLRNLRWILASAEHNAGRVLFLDSDQIISFVSGGEIGSKHNNFQQRIWREGPWRSEAELVSELKQWMGA
jgi:hypothetical protein